MVQKKYLFTEAIPFFIPFHSKACPGFQTDKPDYAAATYYDSFFSQECLVRELRTYICCFKTNSEGAKAKS